MGNSFCLNKNLVALDVIRIIIDAMRFCCGLVFKKPAKHRLKIKKRLTKNITDRDT